MENIIGGSILIILGGLYVVRSDLVVRFQVWSQRFFVGMKCEASERTYKFIRYFGVVIMLIGFAIIAGLFQ